MNFEQIPIGRAIAAETRGRESCLALEVRRLRGTMNLRPMRSELNGSGVGSGVVSQLPSRHFARSAARSQGRFQPSFLGGLGYPSTIAVRTATDNAFG